ncbi:hydroxymethylbilane synthase [Hydrogenobacter thermophilus]|uniref:hydroxymethylbilane synthase n=1 Tax=Hydrogenobacter thermophilus TaxID=940 RepID=UPI0030F649DD
MRLKIGTRKSKLALWQADFIKRKLQQMGHDVQLVLITTSGDKILDVPLAKIGGKGLFVKEIEDALLSGEIDMAVHSLKDVPMTLPKGLKIGAVTERENPFDVLISVGNVTFEELPTNAKIGTSSLRRQVQIKRRRRDLQVETLRGNVDTRIRKLQDGLYDAIILAYAGIKRMGFEDKVSQVLYDFIPAVGQGCLAIEIREDDREIEKIVSELDHLPSRVRAECERAFLKELQGGCQVPIGAYAWIEGEDIFIKGFVSDLEGIKFIEGMRSGEVKRAEEIGKALAQELLGKGAKEILREVYEWNR